MAWFHAPQLLQPNKSAWGDGGQVRVGGPVDFAGMPGTTTTFFGHMVMVPINPLQAARRIRGHLVQCEDVAGIRQAPMDPPLPQMSPHAAYTNDVSIVKLGMAVKLSPARRMDLPLR